MRPVRCEQRRPTQSPRTLNLPHLFRTALCWQRFFSGPQTHPTSFSNVWQTEVYRNWRRGSWRKNMKKQTNRNEDGDRRHGKYRKERKEHSNKDVYKQRGIWIVTVTLPVSDARPLTQHRILEDLDGKQQGEQQGTSWWWR